MNPSVQNPHNVDICVTCVSDKPPKLPLREELPSLGIEVVYNAHGIGAKVSRREQRKKLKEFEERKNNKLHPFSNKFLRLTQPNKSSNNKDVDREQQKEEERLQEPHAISYSSYQKRLKRQKEPDGYKSVLVAKQQQQKQPRWRTGLKPQEDSPESYSSGSGETRSSSASSTGEDGDVFAAYDRYSSYNNNNNKRYSEPPIKSLEIPKSSPEDLAVQAAFSVFSGVTPVASPSENRFQVASPRLDDLYHQTESSSGRDVSESSHPSSSRYASSSTNARSEYQSLRMGGAPFTTSSSVPSSIYEQTTINDVDIASSSILSQRPIVGLSLAQSSDIPQASDESTAVYSVESLQAMAAGYLSKLSPTAAGRVIRGSFKSQAIPEAERIRRVPEGDSTAPTKSVPSIKVSRVNHNNKVAEHYDLTALSSEDETRDGIAEENPDKQTSRNHFPLPVRDPAPASGDAVTAHISPRLHHHFEHRLNFRVPEYMQEGEGYGDDYGRIVLDLSNVEEQDGPGSPLVLSPRTSPLRQRGNMESRQDSPVRVRDDPFSKFGDVAARRLALLRTSRENAIFDDTTTDPDPSSRSRFTFGSSVRQESAVRLRDPPILQSHSIGSNSDVKAPLDAPGSISFAKHYLPPASPKGLGYLKDDGNLVNHQVPIKEGPKIPIPVELMHPSLKKSFSRDDSDSRPGLSVSFSQDVDARYYNAEDDEDAGYEDIIKLVDEIDGGILSMARADPPMTRPREEILDRRPIKEQLISGLMGKGHIPRDAAQFIAKNKSFVKERLPGTKTYPLQAACMLRFPNRFVGVKPCLVKDLVQDIADRKQLILAFLQADASCCSFVDSENDLPVHIISRQLMEWEAMWYQKVYERAREDGSDLPGGGVGITALYQTMSQTVDILLKPLAAKEELCQQPGSLGYLLPLHIAAIFTVSYNTLKSIIERYPAAAAQKCNLTGIRTFIPNLSIPLELHSRLSTDFPKWEIEHYSGDEMEIQWTQSALDRSYGTVGGLRRSDLMFAFHPEVTPYRHDTQRIRRLETRIRSEIQSLEAEGEGARGLSLPVKLVWEWMCSYKGESAEDHYADSVRRIVAPLSAHAVKLLASTPNKYGRSIMDSALDACVTAIEERLTEIKLTLVPVPKDTLSSASRQRCFFLREWEDRTAQEFCLDGRGFVGSLCRTLFNIRDVSYPTSFVLLPYQLIKDSEGRLGLDSAEAAAIAMKFADTLLQLTDPLKILHFLEKKALKFHGTSLGIEASPEWDRVEAKTRKEVSQLLSLYASGKAYFYFIDEYTGVPIVPNHNEKSSYPLIISDAMDTVRRVLPLMLSGMILMRGEKALSVLANVILNHKITMVQDHWVSAAKDLLGYLYSPQTEWTPCFLNDLRPLRAPLVELVEGGVSLDAPTHSAEGLASEWVVELSLVKMLVEMYDANHSLSGLQPRRAGDQKALWTKEASFLESSSEDLFLVDFKSLEELKELSEEMEEAGLRKLKANLRASAAATIATNESPDHSSSSSSSSSSNDLYELLYSELSYPAAAAAAASQQEQDQQHQQQPQDPEGSTLQCFIAEPPPIVRKRLRTPRHRTPHSLIQFDDPIDGTLDDVMRLRILLDEQEAKLDFLRDRVSDLQVAEDHLLEEEDRMTALMNDLHRHTVRLDDCPSPGLSKARKLLLRLCDLEDRVQLRQVEMGQLQNAVTCFELDARP